MLAAGDHLASDNFMSVQKNWKSTRWAEERNSRAHVYNITEHTCVWLWSTNLARFISMTSEWYLTLCMLTSVHIQQIYLEFREGDKSPTTAAPVTLDRRKTVRSLKVCVAIGCFARALKATCLWLVYQRLSATSSLCAPGKCQLQVKWSGMTWSDCKFLTYVFSQSLAMMTEKISWMVIFLCSNPCQSIKNTDPLVWPSVV